MTLRVRRAARKILNMQEKGPGVGYCIDNALRTLSEMHLASAHFGVRGAYYAPKGR